MAIVFPFGDRSDRAGFEAKIPTGASRLDLDRTESTFALGYLASEQALAINGARKQLVGLLDESLEAEVDNWSALLSMANTKEIDDLPRLLARCGIPGIESLWGWPLWGVGRSYHETLRDLKQTCLTVDEDAIVQARANGRQNADTYLAMHDLIPS